MGGKELGIKLFLVVETMSPKGLAKLWTAKKRTLKRPTLKTLNFYQPRVDHNQNLTS